MNLDFSFLSFIVFKFKKYFVLFKENQLNYSYTKELGLVGRRNRFYIKNINIIIFELIYKK